VQNGTVVNFTNPQEASVWTEELWTLESSRRTQNTQLDVFTLSSRAIVGISRRKALVFGALEGRHRDAIGMPIEDFVNRFCTEARAFGETIDSALLLDSGASVGVTVFQEGKAQQVTTSPRSASFGKFGERKLHGSFFVLSLSNKALDNTLQPDFVEGTHDLRCW